jgi:hypothetical protein
MSQWEWDWVVSKVAADMDTTNRTIESSDSIMRLIREYAMDTEMTYEQLLDQAHEHKQTLRR